MVPYGTCMYVCKGACDGEEVNYMAVCYVALFLHYHKNCTITVGDNGGGQGYG